MALNMGLTKSKYDQLKAAGRLTLDQLGLLEECAVVQDRWLQAATPKNIHSIIKVNGLLTMSCQMVGCSLGEGRRNRWHGRASAVPRLHPWLVNLHYFH